MTRDPMSTDHETAEAFAEEVVAALMSSECSWMDAAVTLSYLLAKVIDCCEHDEIRIQVAEELAEKVVEAARTRCTGSETLQ